MRKRIRWAIVATALLGASPVLAQSYSFVGQSENSKTQRQFKGNCSITPAAALSCPSLHTPTNNCKMSLASAGGIDLAEWPYSIDVSVVGNPVGATCPIPAGIVGTLYPAWIFPNGNFNAIWIDTNGKTLMDGIVLTVQ